MSLTAVDLGNITSVILTILIYKMELMIVPPKFNCNSQDA